MLLHALRAGESHCFKQLQDDVTTTFSRATSIPIKRMNVGWSASYVSAIAFQWSRILEQAPLLIATNLVEQINQSRNQMVANCKAEHRSLDVAIAIQQEITLAVSSPGWIVFDVSDMGMVMWLQIMTSLKWAQNFKQIGGMGLIEIKNNTIQECHQHLQRENSQWNDTLMHSQYAHARCCTWLRIVRESHIHLDQLTSWSNHQLQLQIMLQASSAFVLSLVDVVDDANNMLSHIESNEQAAGDSAIAFRHAARKWCEQLSKQVLAFQAEYPLAGVMLESEPFNVNFRLMLMHLTQFLLKALLEDVLHEKAPTVL